MKAQEKNSIEIVLSPNVMQNSNSLKTQSFYMNFFSRNVEFIHLN